MVGTRRRIFMEISGEKENRCQAVHPSSQNLAFLALRAAVELDDILKGRPSSGDAVGQLAQALQETTSVVGGSAALTSLADPLTADLVGRALERKSAEPIESVSALVRQANDIASSLRKAAHESVK